MMKIIDWAGKHIDKLLHMLCCMCAMLSVSILFGWAWGLAASVFLAIGKEAYDQLKYKGWSWGDLLADAAGIAAGMAVVLLEGIL